MFKIGVVFSGSLAKGAFHLGFLKALKENLNNHQLKAVSGTSTGAVIAYSVATDKMDTLEKLWLDVNSKNIFGLWYKVAFKRLIRNYSDILITANDEIKIPLYVSSFRLLPTFKFKYVKYEGNHTKAWNKIMEGSIGFPFVTGLPVLHKKGLYIDGGFVDNIPINPLLKESLDLIFVLHFDNKFNIYIEDNNDVVIINLVLSTYSDFKIKSFDYSKVYIEQLINDGYRYSNAILAKLLKHQNIDDLREEAIRIVKAENKIRQNRNTLDSMPTKMNRLFKKRRNEKSAIISIENC